MLIAAIILPESLFGSKKRGRRKGGSNSSVLSIDSPKQGGLGFENTAEAKSWETFLVTEPGGDLDATFGGEIRLSYNGEYPKTLRGVGKDSRVWFLSILEGMVYEPLLSLNIEKKRWEPQLATHWKISSDSLTYMYRIDPSARWSDGTEVTSEDVLETYKLLIDKGHEDPNVYTIWAELFNQPELVSKYIIKVTAKKKDWRSFNYFSGFYIYPAKYLKKVDGAGYLEKYQSQMMPGTGPFKLNPSMTRKGIELVMENRGDKWWSRGYKRNEGIANFKFIKFLFINDEIQLNERFMNGDFDLYTVNRASYWKTKFIASNYDQIDRGLIQRKKIYNKAPNGVGGIALNSLEEPFNDKRVREAFCYLWDIDKLIDKLFYDEYVRKNSYFPGSDYENPSNPKQTYNPEKAIKLLRDAGWIKKPGDKWITNELGQIFEITFRMEQSAERIYTPLQEDLEKIGIKLNFEIKLSAQSFELIMKRKFTAAPMGWTGSTFPNPEGMMHSKYQRQNETTNITGMGIKKLDQLIEKYNSEWDLKKRIPILQKIDLIATREFHYVLGWYAPYGARMLYWNKFGVPDKGISYTGGEYSAIWLWWYDKDNDTKLINAKSNPSYRFSPQNEVIDYWGVKN